MQTKKDQPFLEGKRTSLPVYGLLLLQSVPNTSQGHEDNDDSKKHHFRGNMLCCQAQPWGTWGEHQGSGLSSCVKSGWHYSYYVLFIFIFSLNCVGNQWISVVESTLLWVWFELLVLSECEEVETWTREKDQGQSKQERKWKGRRWNSVNARSRYVDGAGV